MNLAGQLAARWDFRSELIAESTSKTPLRIVFISRTEYDQTNRRLFGGKEAVVMGGVYRCDEKSGISCELVNKRGPPLDAAAWVLYENQAVFPR